MVKKLLKRTRSENRIENRRETPKARCARWLGILFAAFLLGIVSRDGAILAQDANCNTYCVYVEDVDITHLPDLSLQVKIWDATTGTLPADISDFFYQLEVEGDKRDVTTIEQLPPSPVHMNFVINTNEQDRDQIKQVMETLLQTLEIGTVNVQNKAAIWYFEKDHIQGSDYTIDQGELLNTIDRIPLSVMSAPDLQIALGQINARTDKEKPVSDPKRRMIQEPRRVVILLTSEGGYNWAAMAQDEKKEFVFMHVILFPQNGLMTANCQSLMQSFDCSYADDALKDSNSLRDKVNLFGTYYRLSFWMPSFYPDAKKDQTGTLFAYRDKSLIDPSTTYKFSIYSFTPTGNRLAIEYLVLDFLILLVIFLFLWSALRLARLWDTKPRAAFVALLSVLLAVFAAFIWGMNVNQDFERTVIYAFVQNVAVPTATFTPSPIRATSTRLSSRTPTQTPTLTSTTTHTATTITVPTHMESPTVAEIVPSSKTPETFLPFPTPPPLGDEHRCANNGQEITEPRDLSKLPFQPDVLSIKGTAGPIPQVFEKYELDVLHAGKTTWDHVFTGFQTVPNITDGTQLGVLLVHDINRPNPWLEPGWHILRLRLIQNANNPGGSCFSRFYLPPHP